MKSFLLGLILTTIAAVFSSPTWAQSNHEEPAWQSLEGNWAGHLSYRDFRSNEWVQIPHRRVIQIAPDASWVTMRSSYSDPGREVYGFELIQQRGTMLSIASTGRQGIEVRELQLASSDSGAEGQQWRLTGESKDNGRPARIEYRWQIQGNALTVETWVEYLDAGDSEQAPFIRNRIDLERQS
ncbi:MAG: hypothetical protein AAGJ52_04700 [Pseudomonadota bacterium]